MKNEFKCLSHVERMKNPKVHTAIVKDLCPTTVDVYVEEKFVDDNGRICVKNVRKSIDPREKFEKYKVSDFTIENLTAAGAVSNLKVCSLNDDYAAAVDKAVGVFNAIENIDVEE